jgi:AraC-like DNA-binding protein
MHYRQHALPSPLSRFIECVWFLRSEGSRPPSGPERIVPDGCPELIFQLGDPCRAARPGEAAALQPTALLVGPLTSSLLVEPTGAVATMGVRFRPGGVAAFFPMPAMELTDKQIPVSDLWGRDGRRLEDEVAAAPDDSLRVDAVSRFLRSRLEDAGAPERPVELAVRRMLARRGPVSVEGLARELGLSRRHLERSFLREAGMPPSLLGRVIRFQSVFQALSTGAGWLGAALDCGYYDQSHLIRDFRELAGEAPRAFSREEGPFGGVFVSPQRLEQFFS